MGTCCCKDKAESSAFQEENAGTETPINTPFAVEELAAGDGANYHSVQRSSDNMKSKYSMVDKLILETLSVIGFLVENEMEPPPSMLKLHDIADKESGWIQMVTSMINVIPMNNPLGPAVITLLLDDCPLPAKESVLKLSRKFNLSSKKNGSTTRQRNICVVLGCIAEKLAGPSSVAILTTDTLNYLISNLNKDNDPSVILFSIIALEKFAETSENKITIQKRLKEESKNPLLLLEKWASSTDFVKRQVGFCSQWCLDNLFLVEGRQFSYESADLIGINVMLNTSDVSEYLKISPNGLEARCDAYSFESVRCTFQVDEGVWYYETLIVTPGVMQIGWATKDSTFLNHDGYGIGDDVHSLAYDGCRRLIWYNADNEPQNLECWKPGDTLGCLLDLEKLEMVFYVNGVPIKTCTNIFNTVRSGFFAAASFMSFQQCKFNFGNVPFRFPPSSRNFKVFNDHAQLNPENKVVLPRHIQLEQLRKVSIREDSCTLCFDKQAAVRLIPCNHKGFCSKCSMQLSECPMCRGTINEIIPDET